MNTVDTTISLKTLNCSECGMTYAVSRNWDRQNDEDKRSWWCPNGHRQHYAEREIDRLKKEIQRERQRFDQTQANLRDERRAHNHTNRRLSATQGVVTRTKNRIGKGVCPCCNRSFENLRRHMTSKHPEYAEEKA